MKTCHTLRDVLRSAVELQYRLETWAQCQVSVPRSDVGLIARLRLLKASGIAWKSLQYRGRSREQLDQWHRSLGGKLSGGFFFHAIIPEHHGFSLGRIRLPSLGTAGFDKQALHFPFSALTFAVDVQQDLLVFIEWDRGGLVNLICEFLRHISWTFY